MRQPLHVSTEPTTPTGRVILDILLKGVGIERWVLSGQSREDIIAIEQEAAVIERHKDCIAEWKRRDAASPGIQMTLHDWTAHLPHPDDHD